VDEEEQYQHLKKVVLKTHCVGISKLLKNKELGLKRDAIKSTESCCQIELIRTLFADCVVYVCVFSQSS